MANLKFSPRSSVNTQTSDTQTPANPLQSWLGYTSKSSDGALERQLGTLGQVQGQAQYLLDTRNWNPQPYGGNRVAGFTPTQTLGQNSLTNFALGQGQGLANSATGGVNSALSLGQYNPLTQAGLSMLPQLQQGVGSALNPSLMNWAQQSAGAGGSQFAQGVAQGVAGNQGFALPSPNAALTQALSGQVDPNTINPLIDSTAQRLGQQLNMNILPQVRDTGIAAGGRGSSRSALSEGVARGLAGQELTRTAGDITAQALQNAQNIQAQTGQNIAGLGVNQNLGLGNLQLGAGNLGLNNTQSVLQGLQGAGQLAGQYGSQGLAAGNLIGNLANSGYGTQLNALQTGLNAIPTAFQAGAAPGTILQGVGGQQQQLGQQQLDAAQQLWNEQQAQPINRLSAFLPFVNGGAGGGTGTASPTTGQKVGQAIQGGIGGLSAGSALQNAGLMAAGSPWLAALGGLGALGGLL